MTEPLDLEMIEHRFKRGGSPFALSQWVSMLITEVRALRAETQALRAAVAKHHSQKADDRCWLDDYELYEAFGLPACDIHVGDKEAMLRNCRRFLENRCESGKWASYADLEAEIAQLCNTVKLLDEKLIGREAAIAKLRASLDESVADHMAAKNEIDRLERKVRDAEAGEKS